MFRFIVRGIVQGVGFRPYIYNACVKKNLKGYIKNIGDGVEIVVDNKEKLKEILKEIPPLASIDSIKISKIIGKYRNFSIKKSSGNGYSKIPPDLFLCKDCLNELNDSKNRRYKYFFITCTNCGPRFSIAKKSPYDRKTTTMEEFKMCEDCKKEYTDPKNRRYHAQTIACKNCGPKLSEEISKIANKIKENQVVAVKGVGGFHLVCKSEKEAVKKLRCLTKRKDKPYAIMCKDIEMVKKIALPTKKEIEILESVERPIVLIKKINKNALKEVSELDSLGIILPYTGLHYLLFDYLNEPLVMTSSNYPDNPITTTSNEQISENIISHDRTIENQIDDSLIKVINEKAILIRRSRGFVPKSIKIGSKEKKCILALGAEMNNTFAIYKNGEITISQYMGTLTNLNSYENYKIQIKKLLELTNSKPKLILCDLHPEFNSTKLAKEMSEDLKIPYQQIQHHKAHAYSVSQEHNLKDFVSIVADGLGYGEDGKIWGGEIFDNNERIGGLEEQTQLGGDSATIYPEKMLYSILRKFLEKEFAKEYILNFSEKEIDIFENQLAQQFNSPKTTSCGRILDAVSSLLGFCRIRTYDGRPAMILESNSTKPYELEPIIKNNILLTTPLFEYLIKNLDKDKSKLAATAQLYIAKGFYQIAKQFNKPIIFSGGCAYNKIMTKYLLSKGVKINKEVPPGDGGISFGQIGYYLRQVG